jgi:flagellar biosynthesis activator protein FlaF
MYQFSYAEMVDDAAESGRDIERRAMSRAIELLMLARDKGAPSREAIEAIYFVRRLWTLLIEDLGRSDNDLPEALRADLISIGLWILREADQIRQEKSQSFDGLIEINSIIREGLR